MMTLIPDGGSRLKDAGDDMMKDDKHTYKETEKEMYTGVQLETIGRHQTV